MTSPMSSINTDTSERSAKIKRIQKLTRTLGTITEVPKVLADAVEFSTFRYETGGRSKAARTLLSQAKTEADMSAALDELAEASVVEHTAADTMRTAMVYEQHARMLAALQVNERDIFAALAGRFNDIAPAFDAAARNLPDLTDGKASPFSYSEAQTSALQESKRLAGQLDVFRRPYLDLASLLNLYGIDDSTSRVYVLGDVENEFTAQSAGNMIENASVTTASAYKPVLPYYALTFHGINLSLSAHPTDGQNDREVARGKLMQEIAPGWGENQ